MTQVPESFATRSVVVVHNSQKLTLAWTSPRHHLEITAGFQKNHFAMGQEVSREWETGQLIKSNLASWQLNFVTVYSV